MVLELLLELIADLSVLFVEDVVADRSTPLSWLRYALAWVVYLLHLCLLAVLALATVLLIRTGLIEAEQVALIGAGLILLFATVFWLLRCLRLTRLIWRASVLAFGRRN